MVETQQTAFVRDREAPATDGGATATRAYQQQGRVRRGRMRRIFFGHEDRSPASIDFEKAKNSVEIWSTSPERQDYLERRKYVRIWIIPSLIWFWLGAWMLRPDGSQALITSDADHRWWAFIFFVCSAVTVSVVSVPYLSARSSFRERSRVMAAYRVRSTLKKLSNEEGDIPLAKLFKLNRQQLDEYQQLTKQQQRLSFRMTQITSVLGFLVLLAGISVSMRAAAGVPTYLVAGLTGLGAVLSAYLSRTFFLAHQRADRQLNLYYREPHMMGRVLIAERIMGKSATVGQRDALVNQLLKWPLPESGAVDSLKNKTTTKQTTLSASSAAE